MDRIRRKFIPSLVVGVIFILKVGGVEGSWFDAKHPCEYHDSINITEGGEKDGQGNYHHNGIIYNSSQYGTFHYELINGLKVKTAPYTRGCICAVKGGACAVACCNSHNPEGCRTDFPGYLEDPLTGVITHTEDMGSAIAFTFVNLTCTKYVVFGDEPDDNFTIISTNGTLVHDMVNFMDRGHYCLTSNGSERIAQMCFGDSLEHLKFKIYPWGMLLSVPFLIITFLVYGLIPELRNLHGKNLMSYVVCLTLAYTSMATIQMHTAYISTTASCAWLGYVAYIGFVSSFFWLNVMCFDIWWTFRGVRGIARDSQRKKFILYSLYGWGCPLMIAVFVYMADNLDFIPVQYQPQIGVSTCFMKDDKLTNFLYLYMIMGLQLLFNITLFLCTAYQIRKLQQETKQMTKGGDSRKFNKMDADKDRFGLYIRLFIVMGVTWLAEVLSYAVDLHEYYSYFTDILNCLHGFFIFFLFVWKPKIRELIVKRYRVLRGLHVPGNTFRSSTMTTASNAYSRQSTINGHQTIQMKAVVSKSPNNNVCSEKEKKLLASEEDRD